MSERRFTRPASSIRSTARKSARPRPMTTSGSGPTRSVHCGGTDHTVAPSSCSKRRSPYRLYRLPIQVSRRPNNGWNGCVTRTNCSDGLEESAFSVEIQASGSRQVHLALGVGRCGVDRPRWPICWKASTGAIRKRRGVRRAPAEPAKNMGCRAF